MPWRRPATPADLGMGRLATVVGGAVAAGACADALVEVDVDEVERRARAGARSVHSLPLLDALINLPLLCPVDATGLGERDRRILQAATPGRLRGRQGDSDPARPGHGGGGAGRGTAVA